MKIGDKYSGVYNKEHIAEIVFIGEKMLVAKDSLGEHALSFTDFANLYNKVEQYRPWTYEDMYTGILECWFKKEKWSSTPLNVGEHGICFYSGYASWEELLEKYTFSDDFDGEQNVCGVKI